jgi:hypothetical protein
VVNISKSKTAIYFLIILIAMFFSYFSGIFSERYIFNPLETSEISDIKFKESVPNSIRKNLQEKKEADYEYPSPPRNWQLKGEVRRLSLNSAILKRKLLFNVYLPEDYERKASEGKTFPTCYSFHGGD